MLKKIFALTLIFMCTQANFVFASANKNENKKMTREEICNKNLAQLFSGLQLSEEGTDAEIMQILQKYIFGEVFTVGDLDMKTREMITITTLTTMQTLPQLKGHIEAALNVGVTPIEIREVIYQCGVMVVFPRALNALKVMNEVFKERNIEIPLGKTATVDENSRHKKGLEIQQSLYGNNMQNALKGLPDNMGEAAYNFMVEVYFGDIYTRKGLDIKTRELLAISTLTTLGNTQTLKSHIKSNLKAGNSIETVTATIIQTMPYVGFANGLSALKVVKEVINEK